MERMPISPEQVEGKEFVVTLRGYDKQEVDVFLRELAADYRSALELAEATVGPVVDIDAELDADGLNELSDEVATVLDAARSVAWDLHQRAEAEAAAVVREAEQILDEARTEADTLVTGARERALDLADHAVEEARERLRHLAACERVARNRLSVLNSIIEQALAMPGVDPGVLDIAALERELAAPAEDSVAPEETTRVVDLRDSENAER